MNTNADSSKSPEVVASSNETVGSVVNTAEQATTTHPTKDILDVIREAEGVLSEARYLSENIYRNLSNEEKLEFLKNKVKHLKSELVHWTYYFEKKKKRVGLKRMVLESDILLARKNSDSELGCAKILGVSYTTYRKYCKLYNLAIKGGRPNPKNHWLKA